MDIGLRRRTKRPWSTYYKIIPERPPLPLFLDALSRFDGPADAIDLGCGAGFEALELLRCGWRVLALDKEPTAIERVLAAVPSQDRDCLETVVTPFEEMRLPPAEFIWAGCSLSFTPPAQFDKVWAKMLHALKPGGRLAFDIFGPRHAWSSDDSMTFLSAEEVREKLAGMEIESFVEQEEDVKTALQGVKRWHAFHVIARMS